MYTFISSERCRNTSKLSAPHPLIRETLFSTYVLHDRQLEK